MNLEFVMNLLDVATSVIGTAAVIASVTPTPKDDAIVAPIKKLLDFLAFNFGRAKNAQ